MRVFQLPIPLRYAAAVFILCRRISSARARRSENRKRLRSTDTGASPPNIQGRNTRWEQSHVLGVRNHRTATIFNFDRRKASVLETVTEKSSALAGLPAYVCSKTTEVIELSESPLDQRL
jgi:hypothetical protein